VTPWFPDLPESVPAGGHRRRLGRQRFLAALGEIRQISNTRTAEQIGIAAFWALSVGTPTTAGFWIQVATDGIRQHSLSEREATHLYALLSTTMFDAQIACWDAKETYWFHPALAGRPAHHGRGPPWENPTTPHIPPATAASLHRVRDVLSAFFPEQRDHLNAMVAEAGAVAHVRRQSTTGSTSLPVRSWDIVSRGSRSRGMRREIPCSRPTREMASGERRGYRGALLSRAFARRRQG